MRAARGSPIMATPPTSADTNAAPRTAAVAIVTFAGLRDALGFAEHRLAIDDATTIAQLWERVWRDARKSDQAAALRNSTRFARNGTLVPAETVVADGDEIAFLPPVGGG